MSHLFKMIWIRIFILSFWGIHCSFLQAQSTPKKMGQYLINCYQGDSIDRLHKCFPNPTQLITYGKLHSMNSNEEFIELFKKRYPLLLKEVTTKLQSIKEEGIAKGVDWRNIETDSILVSQKISPSADSSFDSLIINRVDINFHYQKLNYRIIIENVIELEGKCYLDNKVYFREIELE
jgi:hypothetical protein